MLYQAILFDYYKQVIAMLKLMNTVDNECQKKKNKKLRVYKASVTNCAAVAARRLRKGQTAGRRDEPAFI